MLEEAAPETLQDVVRPVWMTDLLADSSLMAEALLAELMDLVCGEKVESGRITVYS